MFDCFTLDYYLNSHRLAEKELLIRIFSLSRTVICQTVLCTRHAVEKEFRVSQITSVFRYANVKSVLWIFMHRQEI